MRIVFVRHGHPDYAKDCLTELGHKQAVAVAERLSDEAPTAIFSSTCGRAYQTAEHIASKYGLDIIKCEFMRELSWGPLNGEKPKKNDSPWVLVDDMVSTGKNIMCAEWGVKRPYSQNRMVSSVETVFQGLDALLETLGYVREGEYYRVFKSNPDTIFIVSHGGSSSAALSHLLNIPFPQVCATMRPNFTAITIVKFLGEDGGLVMPQIELFNDARHIGCVVSETAFDN